MEALLDSDYVHPDELKRFEQAYYEQQRNGGEVSRLHHSCEICVTNYRLCNS